MKPPGLLVNLRAGGIRNRPERVQRIRNLVPADHCQLTRSPEELGPALSTLREAGVETVAIVGGDGTSTWTLSALVRAWPEASLPSVLMLPGGTINTIPSSIGIRGRPDHALERFLETEEPAAHPRRVLRVRPGDAEARIGLVYGTGMAARWLTHYNAHVHRGPRVAATEVARTLGSIAVGGDLAREIFTPFEADVEVDGEHVSDERFTGMAAGAVRHIGLGFQPFLTIPPEGSVDHFHWITTDASGLALAVELPAARLGLPSPTGALSHTPARTVRVRFGEPEPYTIDGELFSGCRELAVEVGPEIRFVTV
jgi:diacylglycerol kinase family enzyme